MTKSSGVLGVAVAAGITLLSGIAHGLITHRWLEPPNYREAAGKLSQVPLRMGDWKLDSEGKLSEETRRQLQCMGELDRRYQNEQTGEMVEIAVLLGPPGPISEHTPEVCMSGLDYQIVRQRQKVSVQVAGRDGKAVRHDLWRVDFQENRGARRRLRVYYAWTPGDVWSAPEPGLSLRGSRITFAKYPYLYKVQAACLLEAAPFSADKSDESDACLTFLQDFLPAAQACLVPPLAKSS